MQEVSTTTVSFPSMGSRDALMEVLRSGAQRLLAEAIKAEAIEAEVAEWIESHAHVQDEAGRRQVVRSGYLPKRSILTGIGPVQVEQPRVLDRHGAEGEVFSSKIPPPYLRKTRSLEALIPWLYLKGVSTGDFSEALSALVGPDAHGLSASTVARLKEVWEGAFQQWSKRSLQGKQYVYLWADGYSSARGSPVHPGAHGSDSRGEEGTYCGRRRLSRERAVVEGTALGREGPRPGRRSEAGHGRRCPGLLESARPGLPLDPRPAVLDP